MKIIEPKISENGLKIVAKRYLLKNETVGQMMWRVCQHLAKAEINWGDYSKIEEIADKFYERMVNLKFVIAGRAMYEAGNPNGTGQLASCFVLPVEDDIPSIFKTLGQAAVIHKNNGGTGFNFSNIRPKGDKVKGVENAASGPIDFLSAFSAALSKILQGSKRNGANIGILNVDHPDILDFIKLKDEDGTIKNFNISIGITNQFMEAVEVDKDWELINPRNGQVVKKIKAKKLFEEIAKHSWLTGDPGIAFIDRMNEDNPTPDLGKIEATNPCGEIPLLPFESCNLASIVLSNHVVKNAQGKYEIDWEDLEKTVKLGVRLLDNMIEINNFPLPEIENMVKHGNRRIGLGVMGFAHLLFLLQIPYDSQEAVRLSERLAKFIHKNSEEMSLQLGKERGVFGNWDRSIYAGSAEKYRNCALNMIAPTGTISLFANCSSGIEPVFSLITLKKAFFEDDKKSKPTQELMIIDPVFEQKLKDKVKDQKRRDEILKQVALDNSLKNIKEFSDEEKQIFMTTHHIKPSWHIKIQAAWQKYFDNSISKTVNFPANATVEDVKKVYKLAWKLGCKGVTIYRDGSKQDQVLNLTGKEKIENQEKIIEKKSDLDGENKNLTKKETIKFDPAKTDKCPECGEKLAKQDNLYLCYECGWSN